MSSYDDYEDRGREPSHHRESNGEWKRKAAIGAAGIVGLTGVVGLASLPIAHPLRKTQSDQIAISYGGGPFEGAEFQGITDPSSGLKVNGFFDKWYVYPTNSRNYIVSVSPDEADKAQFDVIVASDSDGVRHNVELTVTFKLDTTKIREFHEQFGTKYKAWTDEGWRRFLLGYLRQPLNNVVSESMKTVSTDDIFLEAGTYADVQNYIEKRLSAAINELMGDTYLVGPGFTPGGDNEGHMSLQVVVKDITSVDPKIAESYAEIKKSANGIETSRNKAEAQKVEAEGERAAKDAVAEALTPEYLEYLRTKALATCAETPDCTIIVNGSGQAVAPTLEVGR